MRKIEIFDSTLRDGSQGEGISFSVQDKLNIVKKLDEFGVTYIEAGNPGSNPKDLRFFEALKDVSLKQAKICAFGSTARSNIPVEEDKNLISLLSAACDGNSENFAGRKSPDCNRNACLSEKQRQRSDF